MYFVLVGKSATLSYLEPQNGRYFALSRRNR